MADESKVYLGDIGTDIILDTESALATATLLQIKYTKPDGATGLWTGVIADSTKVKYTTQDGDLDIAGLWSLQAYIELPTWEGHGERVDLQVYDLMT